MPRNEGQIISIKQERRTAKKWGGQRTVMSGAGDTHKNDVEVGAAAAIPTGPRYLIENKTRVNPGSRQITIKADDLEQLTKNAIVSGRVPVLQFDLNGRHYVILREDDAIEYLGIGEPE